MKTLAKLRRNYHDKICSQIIRISKKHGQPYPNFADGNSQSSVLIANGIVRAIGFPAKTIPRGEDQLEMLETMIQGNRLRDISDLPFDLAV